MEERQRTMYLDFLFGSWRRFLLYMSVISMCFKDIMFSREPLVLASYIGKPLNTWSPSAQTWRSTGTSPLHSHQSEDSQFLSLRLALSSWRATAGFFMEVIIFKGNSEKFSPFRCCWPHYSKKHVSLWPGQKPHIFLWYMIFLYDIYCFH